MRQRPTVKPIPYRAVQARQLDPTEPEYWRSRLIQRKYTETIRQVDGPEYSARIEHGGIGFFFPLGSADPHAAAQKAAQIYSSLLIQGWHEGLQRFSREITMAIFWTTGPLCCTYTTLYTEPAAHTHPLTALRRRPSGVVIGIVEPDPTVGHALANCIKSHRDFGTPRLWQGESEALAEIRTLDCRLVLLNRNLAGRHGQKLLSHLRRQNPPVPSFMFGIYEESNYIFHSVTGVMSGYLLQRRPPDSVLEPVRRLTREPSRPEILGTDIRRYFQRLFDEPKPGRTGPDPDPASLTRRETDILSCLSQGLTDKEMADRLGISVWTVHGYVKKIFEKYRVHSRTEAVVKYLQK